MKKKTTDLIFERVEDVVDYMRDQGIKITLREARSHAKAGRLQAWDDDGKFRKHDVDRYIRFLELGDDKEILSARRREKVGKTDVDKIRAEERTHLLDLVSLLISKESSDGLQKLLNSGATPVQIRAMMDANTISLPSDVERREKIFKQEMLAAIMKTGAPNPGGGKADTVSGKDFPTLVEEYVEIHKVPKHVALQKVMALHPDKHRKYIQTSQVYSGHDQ